MKTVFLLLLSTQHPSSSFLFFNIIYRKNVNNIFLFFNLSYYHIVFIR